MNEFKVYAGGIPLERMAGWYGALLKACGKAQAARLDMRRDAGLKTRWEDTVLDESDGPALTFHKDSDGTVESLYWSLRDNDGDTQHMEVPASVIKGTTTVAEWVQPEIDREREAIARFQAGAEARERAEYERLRAKYDRGPAQRR